MARLCTKVRDIDNSGRIIRAHGQYFPHGQGLQAFARLENGQGAEQPGCIEIIFAIGHNPQISVMFQSVHKDVTAERVTC